MDKLNTPLAMQRRDLLKFAATATSTLAFADAATPAELAGRSAAPDSSLPAEPASGSQDLVTLEHRGHVLLIGLNRPEAENRLIPPMSAALARAYYAFEQDPTLRVAILFGHGRSFCAGIEVDAFIARYAAGSDAPAAPQTIDPFGKDKTRLSKPVVVVAHGNTLNVGHELFLSADIRLAAADTIFGQMENTQARIPASGATVRFVREAGWGNAMRYILSGDAWTAAEARRMGTLQDISPTRNDAILMALQIAARIAACGPLSIRTTLASAHTALDVNEETALSGLNALRSTIYRTQDFKEGLAARAERRPPVFTGE
ncbi:enoyl-CoA hydratase-related protein [Roseateles chitinivorans]|uniref:enoyl-CoA hydratase-related protein n=1 Tax=Roseateles chitinivorans TaxID=2917965 RepID=UPI003D679453